MQNFLTKKQIIEATGIMYYTLDHLAETGKIEVIRRGKGKDRLYAPDTIEKIKNILDQ